MKKAAILCSLILAMTMVLTGCSNNFTFTTVLGKTTIEIKDDEGGKDAESDSFSVGKGKVLVVESSLEEGQAQIDFVEATVFSNEDDVPDDVILGDTAASITVGPGDSQTVSLEKGDYVMRVSTIGRTNGKIKVTEEKQ